MSLTVKFELKGLAEAKAALKQLPDKLGKRVMQQAARKAANVVLHAARAAAPVDTGNLRKHIKVKALRPMNNQVFTMIIGVDAGYNPAKARKNSNFTPWRVVVMKHNFKQGGGRKRKWSKYSNPERVSHAYSAIRAIQTLGSLSLRYGN
jgi:hypothetical protein